MIRYSSTRLDGLARGLSSTRSVHCQVEEGQRIEPFWPVPKIEAGREQMLVEVQGHRGMRRSYP